MKNSTKKTIILFLLTFFYLMIGAGFDAHAVNTEPVFIRLPVQQSFSFQNELITNSTEKFTYEFTSLENGNPMPSGTTGGKYETAIIGNQTVEIGEIVYTHAGFYNYQVKAASSNNSGDYTCDVTEYTVTVCVRNEGNGQLGKPEVIIKNNNGQKSGNLAYNYVSVLATTGVKSGGGTPQTGDRSQVKIWIALFVASILFIILLLIKRKKDSDQDE